MRKSPGTSLSRRSFMVYRGYIISGLPTYRPEDERYAITRDGCHISYCRSVKHAKEIIDSIKG